MPTGTAMQSKSEAIEQAKDTIRRLEPLFDMDPDLLSREEERELFEAVAFLDRHDKISDRELVLRIRRQKRG